MRKFLTTGFLGVILGLLVGAPADASLISRSFLDQALTDYATNTALDLKANQSDFTDLNTQISDSVDVLRQLLEQGFYSYELVNGTINPEKFPNTISGAFNLLHQYLEASAGSTLYGWPNENGLLANPGLKGMLDGWTSTDGRNYLGVKGLNDKIGTLPSGNFLDFPESERFFSDLRQPFTYPTSLAELINAIYGDAEASRIGLLPGIIAGFSLDTDGDGDTDAYTGLIPNFRLANDANNLAKANAAKIGDLPTEYATVGAALTAIKGIAEEAKAAAVAAIPDPKTEGSSGKYVLTVDIIGDNATYRWEKIDRSESESTTTE